VGTFNTFKTLHDFRQKHG